MVKAKIKGQEYQYGEFNDVDFPVLVLSQEGRVVLATRLTNDISFTGVLLSNGHSGRGTKEVGESTTSWSRACFRLLGSNEQLILNN